MATSFKGEKLMGKSNYIEWLNEAKLYLEINGFMPYIDGTETSPIKSLYYKGEEPYSPELAVKYIEKESEFKRNSYKALGAIKSIISLDNIDRFKDKTSAKDLWEAIEKTYGESSLELINRYLNKIISSNYNSSTSIDDYTSQIQSAALYLKELGYAIPDPLLACLVFKGLPSSFDNFASRKYEELAKNIANINIPKLISELISEEARMTSNIGGEANKASKSRPICRHCNKTGHLESNCFIKHPELINDFNSNKNKKGKFNKNNKKENKEIKTESSKAIMMAVDSSNINDNKKFILDSGATEHYTPYKDWLLDFKSVNNKFITVANGQKIQVKGVGNIPLKLNNNNTSILLKEVYYIPELKQTLVSSKELTNKGWLINFKKNLAEVVHPKHNIKINAFWDINAYYLNINLNYDILEPVVYQISSNYKAKDLNLYHKRLNHINKELLIKTIQHTKGLALNKENQQLDDCEPCNLGKFHVINSKEPLKSADKLIGFDLDIAGPFKEKGLKEERYFLALTDRGTRAIWVYPLKHKSDCLDIIINFYNLILNQFNIKIKFFRLDNAQEFKSVKFTLFIKEKGIICEYTSPYSAPQNGISERLNRYIVERIIAIAKEKNIPLSLWPYLIQGIAHIKNRTYNSIINKTPYEALTGKMPTIGYIKTLGSLVYTLNYKANRKGKLDDKSKKGILVGFESSNNYLVFIPEENKVINTKDIIIKEDLIYKKDFINNENYNEFLNDSELQGNPNVVIDNDISSHKNSNKNNPLNFNRELTEDIIEVEIPNIPSNNNPPNIINNNNNIRTSSRLKGVEPENQGLINNKGLMVLSDKNDDIKDNDHFYALASQAFSSIKEELKEEENNLEEKIIINFKDNNPSNIIEPNTYQEAIKSPYKEYWEKAMKKELNSLKK